MNIMHMAGLLFRAAAFAAAILAATAGAASADNFGAIAFSQGTGGFGFSYDHGSRRDAENRAMAECRARTRGCKVAIWFKNACGSVARGPNGWGSAWAGSRRQAEQAALRNCSQHSRGCRTLAWSCS
tara:strand:+ start:1952 stop:2332 length:381 start_codon:yes stop_codon:yes gene_type:complete